ncbi:lipopolysaccharide biosynthesis protein [Caulobacter sp. NIBR1757]|uniref:lipopolysaccharide biosynthesis protein n=1 Tax=Caulobacter sp. NIBR1757 TaxID=3016000 RepID=UPI0022F047E4|nr:lipopolysaccharide biosynthesis protein [Caulobacter sp. NIBR1757]WGM40039.1 hypothetical protein AMEJIAPC_02980 [Caulobacter sp. NIBR1757]
MNLIIPLKAQLSRVIKSTFVRAVTALSTGQLISAVIPILAAPILGRLYLPADYGVLATFMAASTILSAVSTFQLQQGVIAEHGERRAVALVVVCRRVGYIVSAAALVLALGIVLWMGESTHYAASKWWMLGLPLTTASGAVVAATAALANRYRRYGTMAQAQVLSAVVTVATSVSLGVAGWGASGLFVSYFLSQLVTLFYYLWLYRQMVPTPPRPGVKRTLVLIRSHRRFAIFTLPAVLISNVSQQLPVFSLAALGLAPLVGAFARARQLASMPIQLLGSSVGQVFRQRASEMYRATGSCRPEFVRTFFVLLGMGLAPTIALMLYGRVLFEFVLGPQWGDAGKIAGILAPMLLLRLVSAPLSQVFYFTGRQVHDLVIVVSNTALLALILAVVLVLKLPAISIVYVFSVSYSIMYVVYLAMGWRASLAR